MCLSGGQLEDLSASVHINGLGKAQGTQREKTQCLLLVESQTVVGLQSFQEGVTRLGVVGSLNSSQ